MTRVCEFVADVTSSSNESFEDALSAYTELAAGNPEYNVHDFGLDESTAGKILEYATKRPWDLLISVNAELNLISVTFSVVD